MLRRKSLSDMKIYIIDVDEIKAELASQRFSNLPNVEIVNRGLESFMDDTDAECVVCAANNKGTMDGGFERAIENCFGEQLSQKIRESIDVNFYGEQPVGTSFIIDAGKSGQKLIHAPVVISRKMAFDDKTIYHCTRSALICAMDNNIKSIVFPIMGSWTGGVDPELSVERMYHACAQLLDSSESPERFASSRCVARHVLKS